MLSGHQPTKTAVSSRSSPLGTCGEYRGESAVFEGYQHQVRRCSAAQIGLKISRKKDNDTSTVYTL